MAEGTSHQEEFDNIKTFNLMAGYVFSRLYKAFPRRVIITPRDVMGAVLPETEQREPDILAHTINNDAEATRRTARADDYVYLAFCTMEWLKRCNYILADGKDDQFLILSPKGFEVLAATPKSLISDDKLTLGEKLTDATLQVAKAEGRQVVDTAVGAVTELVGQVIGSAVRSWGGFG